VIHEFRVRWYQQDFHRALVERTHDRLIAIWHRRAGKDEVVLNAFRELAFKRPATYWHCFPEYAQARKAIWNGVDGNTGKRRLDQAFPPEICKRRVDNDMFIEFKNGATWQLLGSDRYDATVGAGPAGIAYSEWALCNPAAWAYHSPMIRETGGFAAFITTPRGNNHAKAMYDRSQTSDSWFGQLLTVDDTEALTEAALQEALEEYQDVHGIDLGLALFEQEYYCSFSGAMIGAYFGAEMNRAEREGRIKEFEIDWNHPVHTAWDLGKAVNNPIWCFQVINNQPLIVDFYQPESENVRDWVTWLDERGYTGFDFVPHDIMVTEWGNDRTRKDILFKLGRKPIEVPRVSVADGLQAARETINAALFRNNERTLDGIEGLKNFRREWDEDAKVFRQTPVKDWAEHRASAFRYLGLAWQATKAPVKKAKVPTELVYEARPDGRIVGNMDVKQLIKARRRARNE
jgi:phage terminase large subunit